MTGNEAAPRVVVGVDGSPSSYAALRWAIRHAQLIGGTVDAVGAWETLVAYGWSAPVIAPDLDEGVARRKFDQELAEVLGDGQPVEVRRRLVPGNPADVLIDAARGAELLVVGSRGHGTFARALLGSVSERCALHAPCPVVIVREG
ncbi:nucleotide-binding universal stress UspA family protein [Kitasatospora sp. MAP12-15]|uniref:universal stress protein n=1 Tax=unclassified Kitasatospora TaxID=2633591 RepID=UPI0024733591|nr:universal stress protein [Kitasatospora sp. MAP12-44]MDH6115479.1 nucleotide-binding universal stress UspA family protein [Kitasatospora sp. MAP12-44]